jgi:hypothetical protein
MSRTAKAAGDLAATVDGFHAYRRRAGIWASAGTALFAAGVLLGGFVPTDVFDDLAAGAIGLSTVMGSVGFGALVLARRMRRVLTTAPWRACAAVAVPRTLHAATVVLTDPVSGDAWPLKVVAVRQRYGLADPGPVGVLWWSGAPGRAGVLAPPGGEHLIWAKPVRGRLTRRRLVRQAESLGLAGRPRPRQPQPTGKTSAGTGLTRPRRGPKVFRWVPLVAVLCLGLGIAGAYTSDHDPRIDLTVLSEESDGSCVVRWTDPFDGRQRTGPYHCDPGRSPLLHDWETGFVVSYGPWKGDLYNADWEGTSANETVGAVGLTGLLLALVSLVGGAMRWRRRRLPAEAIARRDHETT